MAERAASHAVDGGSFFEGPRWHEGRWWVSDFYRHRVVAVDPGGREEEVMAVEGRPSGLGWMPDGSLLVVSMRDHRILRRTADGSGRASTPTSASSAPAISTTWSSTATAARTRATSAST